MLVPVPLPVPVLNGVWFRQGNEFVERVLLLLVPVADFPTGRSYTRVPWRVMHTYTLVQLACFGTVVFVSLDPFDVGLGLAFPFLLLLNIPLRKCVWLLLQLHAREGHPKLQSWGARDCPPC